MADFVLNAETREDVGKGASRRLRRLEDKVPAIVYGGEGEPRNITLTHKDISKATESEAFFSHIITVNIGKDSEEVILKDLQRHPSRGDILHVDFQRIVRGQKMHFSVPLHFINEETCPGVKLEGGMISHSVNEIEVVCLPKELPEYIEVDMADMKLGDTYHLSELKLPEGVESADLLHGEEYDLTLAAVIAPRSRAEEEAEEEAAAAEEGEAPEGGTEEGGEESEGEESGED